MRGGVAEYPECGEEGGTERGGDFVHCLESISARFALMPSSGVVIKVSDRAASVLRCWDIATGVGHEHVSLTNEFL